MLLVRIENKVKTYSKDGPVQNNPSPLALKQSGNNHTLVQWRGEGQGASYKHYFNGIAYILGLSAIRKVPRSLVRIEDKIKTSYQRWSLPR